MPCSCACRMPRFTCAFSPKSSAFTMRCLATIALQAQVAQPFGQHYYRSKRLPRDFARGLAVTSVVGLYRIKSGHGFLHGAESEQTETGRQHGAKTGILRDDRPAGGEVTGTALAEPAAAQSDVEI